MTPRSTAGTLLPSLLDRLTNLEPGNQREAPAARSVSMREIRESVRRDLEWLLNSRRTPDEPPETARELWRSVYCYGLADITSVSLSAQDARVELARRIEIAIATFEPRLRNVRVQVVPSTDAQRVLRFQIEALLRTEPSPSRVFFDTTLDSIRGAYEVLGDSNAR